VLGTGTDSSAQSSDEEVDLSDLPSSKPEPSGGPGSRSAGRGGRNDPESTRECVIYRSQPVAPSCLLYYDGPCPTLLITVYCGEGGTPRFGWELVLLIAGEIETAVIALIGQRTGGFS